MPKFIDKCDFCNGQGYIRIGNDSRPFPKGDWVECPQCDTTRKMVAFQRTVTPPLIFTGMGMPDNIRK